MGSVRDVTTAAGTITVVYHTDYDAFGTKVNSTGTLIDRFGYTGREHDPVFGLRYHRARYFDEALSRWTQEDPAGFSAGDVNLYRYVGNARPPHSPPSAPSDQRWSKSDRSERMPR